MNIALWILAGGVMGWFGYTALNANAERDLVVSIIIGMVGGFLGGHEIAPMSGAAAASPGDFSPFALFIAGASAAGCLTISDIRVPNIMKRVMRCHDFCPGREA